MKVSKKRVYLILKTEALIGCCMATLHGSKYWKAFECVEVVQYGVFNSASLHLD